MVSDKLFALKASSIAFRRDASDQKSANLTEDRFTLLEHLTTQHRTCREVPHGRFASRAQSVFEVASTIRP